jgi:hypothetical protein
MANPFRGEGYQSGDSLGTETGAAGPGTAGPGARPGELAPGAEGRTAQPADRTGVRGDPGAEVSIGVDWGATLAKLAVQRRGEPPEFRLLPCAEPKACSRVLEELHALTEPDDVRIGVTGGGADRLTREICFLLQGQPITVPIRKQSDPQQQCQDFLWSWSSLSCRSE